MTDARTAMAEQPPLAARDPVHVAVMQRAVVEQVDGLARLRWTRLRWTRLRWTRLVPTAASPSVRQR